MLAIVFHRRHCPSTMVLQCRYTYVINYNYAIKRPCHTLQATVPHKQKLPLPSNGHTLHLQRLFPHGIRHAHTFQLPNMHDCQQIVYTTYSRILKCNQPCAHHPVACQWGELRKLDLVPTMLTTRHAASNALTLWTNIGKI